MFGFWPIYKKELKAYMQSPSTYVVLALIFLMAGYLFQDIFRGFSMQCQMSQQYAMMGQQREAPNITAVVIRGIFGVLNFIVLFSVPMLAMRLISEEKSRGTFELLVTCPISDWAIVMGKYLALLTIGVFIIVISAIYPFMVWWIGRSPNPVDSIAPEWPIVFSCWVGLFLLYATYSAFGVMASAMSENQISAGIITLIGLLLWYFMGEYAPENATAKSILQEVAISQHIENFIKGIILFKDFAFYILVSFLFLFIGTKTLDARRWRL